MLAVGVHNSVMLIRPHIIYNTMIRKVQVQPGTGTSTRTYHRLRLPNDMATEYVAEYGEYRYIRVVSANALQIDGDHTGIPIHILDVREGRGLIYKHFKQIMFPRVISGGMIQGDVVDVSRDGDHITLQFDRDIFQI